MDSIGGLTKSWQRWGFLFIFIDNQFSALAKICCPITVGCESWHFFSGHLSNSRLFLLKGGKTLTYILLCYFELERKARSHHESPEVMQNIPVVMGPTCHLSGRNEEKGGGCWDNWWVISIKVKDNLGRNHMYNHQGNFRFSFNHLIETSLLFLEMSMLLIMALM